MSEVNAAQGRSPSLVNPSWTAAFLALAGLLIARLALAAALPLVEDEAYYWEWSRHLAAGYFDHPPGIAWLIALGEGFGRTEIAVRAGPVLAGIAATAILARQSRDPLRFVVLIAGIPLYALGGVFATPDVPLLLGWSIAAAALLSRRFVWVGIGVGLAGLGKYTGWGFWPLAAGALVVDAVLRPRPWAAVLRSAGVGLLSTLIVLSPNLVWNAQHAWASVKFQAGHGLDRPPGGALAFFGAQVGLAGPVFFVLGGAWCLGVAIRAVRAVRSGDERADAPSWEEIVPFTLSAPVVLFFTFAATRGSGEANWAAPAYLSVALALSNAVGRWARAAWIAGGIGLATSGLLMVHLVRPLASFPGDPAARLGLGRDLATSVQAWDVAPVYTSRYQEAAMIAFYGGVEAYALPGVDRPDQYDLWPIRWAPEALFVRTFKSGPSATIDPFCKDRSGANVVSEYAESGEVKTRWQVYAVSDCGPAGAP